MKPGNEIEVKPAASSRQIATRGLEENRLRNVPGWLSLNAENLKATVVRLPVRDEMEPSINEQLIENVFTYDEVDENGLVVRRYYKPLKLRWMYRYETEHLLARSGFAVETLYGGFDRRPFDEDSREMIWVARKA